MQQPYTNSPQHPPTARPPLSLIGQSLDRYLGSLGRYLGAALACWFAAVIVPLAAAPDIRPLMGGGLFCCFHGLYAATASLAARRWNKTLPGLAFQRSSGHSLTLIAFLLGLFLLLGAVLIAGLLGGAPKNAIAFYATGAGMALATLWYLLRFWPVLVTLFLYDGAHRWTPSKGGVFWDGPSFGTAWRMTGLPNAPAKSMWLLAASLLVLAPHIIILQWFSAAPVARYTGIVYFFTFAAPVITQLAYDFGETLRVKTTYDKTPAAPRGQGPDQEQLERHARELYEKTGILTMNTPAEFLDPPHTGPTRWSLVRKHFLSLRNAGPVPQEHYLAFIQDFDDLVNRQSALRLIGYGGNEQQAADEILNSGQRHPGLAVRLLAKKWGPRQTFLARAAQTLDAFALQAGDYVLLEHAPTKRTVERVVIAALVSGREDGARERAEALLAGRLHFCLLGQVVFIGDSEHPYCAGLVKKRGASILSAP